MKTFIGALLVILIAMTARADEWKLVWSDEFDKKGAPDADKWDYEVGFIRNHEKQFYTKARQENARVEDGMLIIEARKEKYKDPRLDPAATGSDSGKPPAKRSSQEANYTSASLNTRGKAAWSHGRIVIRAKLPSGRGTWPAFWTLGTNFGQVGWPRCGEIDIMEHVGFDPGVVHANIHTRKYNHMNNIGKGDRVSVDDVSDNFHLYSVEWDHAKMDFFVDSRKYFTYKNEGTGEGAWPFDKDQYLILNIAIGGDWGGQKGIDESIFPQRCLIDYVRVYQKPQHGD